MLRLNMKRPIKTRNRAYDIPIEIAHAFGDEERGKSKGRKHTGFNAPGSLQVLLKMEV